MNVEFLTETALDTWAVIALCSAMAAAGIAGSVIIHKRGKRIADRLRRPNPTPTAGEKLVEKRLFVAAIIASSSVLLAVLAMSFNGLVAFAERDMQWHGALSYVVPLSLDGISISFGLWAFVSIKRGRHAAGAMKIVWAAAIASAVLNYIHGSIEYSKPAGAYLAAMSIFAMRMFHEMLVQFERSSDIVMERRVGTPAFGERWFWAPWSTLLARRAWVVYPPSSGIESTVEEALNHLDRVRIARRAAKGARATRVAFAVAQAKADAEAEVAPPSLSNRDTVELDVADRPDPYRPAPTAQSVPDAEIVPARTDQAHRDDADLVGASAARGSAAVPAARGSAADDTGELPIVRNGSVTYLDARRVREERRQLSEIARAFPGLTWQEIRTVPSQNEIYRKTSIRRPRIKALLLESDLAEQHFPEGFNGPADKIVNADLVNRSFAHADAS